MNKKRVKTIIREREPAEYDRLRYERDTAVQALTGLRRQLKALAMKTRRP